MTDRDRIFKLANLNDHGQEVAHALDRVEERLHALLHRLEAAETFKESVVKDAVRILETTKPVSLFIDEKKRMWVPHEFYYEALTSLALTTVLARRKT